MDIVSRVIHRIATSRGYVSGDVVVSPIFGGIGIGADPNDRATLTAYGDYIRTSNAVYACVTLRSRMLSSLPLKIYKAAAGSSRKLGTLNMRADGRRLAAPGTMRGSRAMTTGDVVEVTSGRLYDLLHRVNPHWTFERLAYVMETSLCLWGSTYTVLERGGNAAGVPLEMWWVKSDRMKPIPDTVNYVSHFEQARRDGGSPKRFETSEVLWMRYPNPLDEFAGLSPVAAARVAADVATAAMRSNRDIFRNGLGAAAIVMPEREGAIWTEAQAQEVERDINRRFMGEDKRHKTAVFRSRIHTEKATFTPEEAQFLQALDFSVEDIARAYGVPIELVGGARRTYQNLAEAKSAIWGDTIAPEARFIATELTEQLLPMFGDEADFVAFDLSGVAALQDDAGMKWGIEQSQLAAGVLRPNEWRADAGLEPLTVDAVMDPARLGAMNALLVAVGKGEVTAATAKTALSVVYGLGDAVAAALLADTPAFAPPAAPVTAPASQAADAPHVRAVNRGTPEFGSDEHRALWEERVKISEAVETAVKKTVKGLFGRQLASVVDRFEALDNPKPSDLPGVFQKPRWVREFREAIRPGLRDAMRAGGGAVAAKLVPGGKFDEGDPAAVRFLVGRAQRFATEVNDTTWEMLKASLAEGMKDGDTMDDLTQRVRDIFTQRSTSGAEMIARTEVIGAFNGGSQLAAEATGLDLEKTWITALDERVRADHADAHGQTVALDEDFEVGDATGPAPGQMGDPAQDINCRCVATYGERGRAHAPENTATSTEAQG